METAINLNIIFGTIISVLLSIVAYFIKQLHSDFIRMEKDLTEVKTMAILIKTEFKSSNDLLNQKVDYLERRVNKIELKEATGVSGLSNGDPLPSSATPQDVRGLGLNFDSNVKIYSLNAYYDFNNFTAILYLNNCDGGTELKIEDKIKFIQSEENKILIFNSKIIHRSVSSNKNDRKYILNFNYF